MENVDAAWLLKAAALAIAGALVCAYATLCLLVYQGQWQLVLHPSPAPPLAAGPLVQNIRFGAGDTGQPQLAGLWLTAANPLPTTPTILYLPDGSGSLAQDAAALEQLHGLPVNLFAFDYRGFGASAPAPHPTETSMVEDAETAFDYLVNTEHIAPASIVPYGVGLGASLAAGLAQRHRVPALILEAPRPNATEIALADSRARLVPLHLFFHERFDLSSPLSSLKTPRLLLESGPSSSPTAPVPHSFSRLAASAGSPSIVVHLDPAQSASSRQTALWRAAILRFLDEYMPTPPSALGGQTTR